MNDIIAGILKDYVDTLAFADKIAGMVRIAERTGEAGLKQYFPVACNLTEAECNTGRYMDLIPDGKKKSVIYFEEKAGVQLLRRGGSGNVYESKLRLVVWLNLKLLGIEACTSTAGAMGDILRVIPNKIPQTITSPFGIGNMIVTFEGEALKSADIFSKYSYNQAQTQYLLFPYDYFALDFTIELHLNKECLPSLTPGEPNNCNDK
jgi:hypothetical protein